jgi:hypothetical protein
LEAFLLPLKQKFERKLRKLSQMGVKRCCTNREEKEKNQGTSDIPVA